MQVSFTSSSYFHPSFSLPRFFSPPPCDKQISIEARKFQIPNSNPSFLQEYNTLEKRRRNKNKNNNNNNSSSRSRKKEDRNFAFHSRARTLVPEFYSSSLTSPPLRRLGPSLLCEKKTRGNEKRKKKKKTSDRIRPISLEISQKRLFSSRRGKTGWKPVKVYLKEDERGKKNYRTAVHARTYI